MPNNEEIAEEWLRRADKISDRNNFWELRLRFAHDSCCEEEMRARDDDLKLRFYELKKMYCEHREEIHSATRTSRLQLAIDSMEICIQDDLEREFRLASHNDDT